MRTKGITVSVLSGLVFTTMLSCRQSDDLNSEEWQARQTKKEMKGEFETNIRKDTILIHTTTTADPGKDTTKTGKYMLDTPKTIFLNP